MSKTKKSATLSRKSASAKAPTPIVQAPVAQLANASELKNYSALFQGVSSLLEASRHVAARSVNAIMTTTYWEIGKRIVEHEQGGKARAEYGEVLLKKLGADLSSVHGRGYGWRNLFQMRAFYLAFPAKLQTLSAISGTEEMPAFHSVTKPFPLPWSAYVRLLAVKNEHARRFYEAEALRGGWSVRQLDRQIDSQFYERTALSKNKAAMHTKGGEIKPEDTVTPEQAIKDPFVLEFLNLKDEYSETTLEEGLISHLETFLLELGSDFAFIGRQRRLRIGDEWCRVDLLFFHRRLRCLVIIDLKLGKFTHADAGQMHMYLNYAREHWTHPDENPPVGLILCAQKNEALAHYALEGLPNKVMATEYRTALPEERLIAEELDRTRRLLEERKGQ